jgi:hypothetical protein
MSAAAALVEYNRLKERLTAAFDGLIDCARRAECAEDARSLRRQREVLAADRCRVVVVGQWKTGKTTLINALLGSAGFLPTRVVEATGNVNIIRYGPNPRAVVHFCADSPGGEPPEPREVRTCELADFVLIKSLKKSGLAGRIDHVEVFYPLPLCENGVELVDTPGLNAGEAGDRATLSFIPQADAVILVMKAPAAFGEAERKLLEYHIGRAHVGKVFYVVNGRNLLRGVEQVQELLEDLREKIGRYAGGTVEPKVYLVDALAAEERAQGAAPRPGADTAAFDEFRADLERFLTEQKTELTAAAALSRAALGAALLAERIAAHRRALENRVETLQARYDSIRPRFEELHRRKEAVIDAVRAGEARLQEALDSGLKAECRRLAGPALPESLGAWLRGEPAAAPALPAGSGGSDNADESVAVAAPAPDAGAAETAADVQDFLRRIPLSAQDTGITLVDRLIPGAAASKARDYILARLSDYLRLQLRRWADGSAQAVLRAEADTLLARVGPRARDIFDELHRMQVEFSAPAGHDDRLSDGERIGVAVLGGLGLLAANPTALLGGALGGIGGAVRQLSVTVGAGLLLLLLHVHNPLAWPAVIVANVLLALLWEGEQKTRRLRFALAKGAREQLLGDAADKPSAQMRDMVARTFARCRGEVQTELDGAIRSVQAEMEKVLSEAGRTAEEVAARKADLDSVRGRVEEIARGIAALAEHSGLRSSAAATDQYVV